MSKMYNGIAQEFRAQMTRLLNGVGNEWIAASGERLVVTEWFSGTPLPPERAAWQVVVRENLQRKGGIEAYQGGDGTVVEFKDAYSIDVPWAEYQPIGAAFEEFTDWVIQEIWPTQGAGVMDTETDEHEFSSDFPRWMDAKDVIRMVDHFVATSLDGYHCDRCVIGETVKYTLWRDDEGPEQELGRFSVGPDLSGSGYLCNVHYTALERTVKGDKLAENERNNEFKVIFERLRQKVKLWSGELYKEVIADRRAKGLPLEPTPAQNGESGAGDKRGPTHKTKIRAKVFKQIKDKHPGWSQAKVALEAMEQESWLGEISGETVRNAYRAMGWDWERADRVR